MALQTWKCTNCEEQFKAGDWHCKSGEAHVVENKTYYVTDAPADRRDCKNARLVIHNIIPEKRETSGVDVKVIPGVHVEFIRGQYATDDPQLQMGLDKHKGVLSGPEGMKAWEQVYFSDAEKQELNRIRLKGENSRLEAENNRLLAEIQAKQKKAS